MPRRNSKTICDSRIPLFWLIESNYMDQEHENSEQEAVEHGFKEKISGFGQKVIGEIETIGGVLTGDPNTQAEGEFNVEVGDIRDELEESVEGDGESDK